MILILILLPSCKQSPLEKESKDNTSEASITSADDISKASAEITSSVNDVLPTTSSQSNEAIIDAEDVFMDSTDDVTNENNVKSSSETIMVTSSTKTSEASSTTTSKISNTYDSTSGWSPIVP